MTSTISIKVLRDVLCKCVLFLILLLYLKKIIMLHTCSSVILYWYMYLSCIQLLWPILVVFPCIYCLLFFSSPKLKAQVRYSDHFLFDVRLSVHTSICTSVCKLFTLMQKSWNLYGIILWYCKIKVCRWGHKGVMNF